ncbi:MAG: phenylalanine--tRNA ligase subunit beta, partial [Myxococcota bacterium]
MLVSFQWLRELVDLPPEVTAAQVAERLTLAGLEVDGIEDQGAALRHVVVGKLTSKMPHPDADKLTLCVVDAGGEAVPVVCGAKNHNVGDLVVLARVGARLPGGLEIKATRIRGAVSEGMLCSARELGLSDENDGILLLDPKAYPAAVPGASAATALGRDDAILDVAVTPNRPDALSHVGIAREIVALLGARSKVQRPVCAERGGPIDDVAQVEIKDSDGGTRYACRVIEDVKVGPSPAWLVQRLAACGVRSVNNIVDVTNLVMMERGLPLHAFDLDCIGRSRDRAQVIVRRAERGERIETLDGKERELEGDDLVIADPQGPIAIAGVMGGAATEVRETTTRVLLEAAHFSAARVRKTARRLGIHSEASHRFERGCDPNGVRLSLDRAASLMAELSAGVVCRGVVDVYPRKQEEVVVPLRPKRAAEFLGLSPKVVNEATCSKILLSLGLEVAGREGDAVRFRVPTFRPDLTREVDLMEEVVRVLGYDQIPATLPARTGASRGLYDDRRVEVEQEARTALEAAGYTEAVNLAFTSPAHQLGFPGDGGTLGIAIQNPLGEEMSLLRRSLLPGLLANVALNQRRGHTSVRLYEAAGVFAGRNPLGEVPGKDVAATAGGDAWADERPMLAAIAVGEVGVRAFDRRPTHVDFYDIKGVLESILERVGLDVKIESKRVDFSPADDEVPYLHPRARAALRVDGELIGFLGELHPDVLARYDIRGPVLAFELQTKLLAKQASRRFSTSAPPRFPAVRRDFALLLDEKVPVGELCRALAAAPLVE